MSETTAERELRQRRAQELASRRPFGPVRPSEITRHGMRRAIERQQERHAQARANAFKPSPSAEQNYTAALRRKLY
jgi:hypothetical protein